MQKKVYNAAEASEIVKKFVRVPRQEVVGSLDEIKMEPPLVLKLLSRDALHKTEFNGVQIVKYREAIKPAFDSIMKEAEKRKLEVDGILVQEYIPGVEAIIGIKKDPVFGHMIIFGAGGIFTEIFADTSTRKCPVSLEDAEEMIKALRSGKMFRGARGMNVDIEELKKAIVSVSRLPLKNPEIEELDINPFTSNSSGCFAVDVRIITS